MSAQIELTIVTPNRIELSTGPAGPIGEKGEPGEPGPVTITRIAATAIGGHRAVRLNANDRVIYADCTTITDASAVIGITTGAVDQGDNAIIQLEGELIEPSWNWNIDLPIFLSTQGQLTQIVPLTGFLLCVAIPIATDRVIVRIGEPILL